MSYTNIKSQYIIKKFINESFVKDLNNINSKNIKKEFLELDITNKLSQILSQQYNENDINDKITSKQSLARIIDCEPYIANNDKNKEKIMNIVCNSLFIPFQIIQWIETQCKHGIKIFWDNVEIYILNDEPIAKFMYNHIIKIVKWIIKISRQIKPKINLFIYLSKFKKELCDKCALGIVEMNSGVSYTDHWLQIFREEELYKVLIHELLHNLQLDVNLPNYCVGCSDNINMHELSQPILINEGYTEVMALYLYCIYCGTEQKLDIWELLLNEEKFTIYQINKIFKHYEIDNISYFSMENDFIQKTSVIPYFILKYLFLLNIKYFTLSFYDKKKTETLMRHSMEKLYKLKIPKCKVIDKSLRMSIHELL